MQQMRAESAELEIRDDRDQLCRRSLHKVAIHGVPRSGTSWVGEIFNSSPHTVYKFQPLFSYALKEFVGPHSAGSEIEDFFDVLETTTDEFLDQAKQRANQTLPAFEKTEPTHVGYKEVRYHGVLLNMMRKLHDVRVVLVVRSPLAVINSWLQAPREFRADLGWKPLEEWRYALKKNLNRPEEFNGFERWKDATNLFLAIERQFPNRACIIEYRALLADTEGEVARMFEHLGLAVPPQTLDFISKSTRSSDSNPYSVWRQKESDDKWKRELLPEIAAEIRNDLSETDLERFL